MSKVVVVVVAVGDDVYNDDNPWGPLFQVNEIYERYVPSSWTKPTPDADQHQREQWILAKYKHR